MSDSIEQTVETALLANIKRTAVPFLVGIILGLPITTPVLDAFNVSSGLAENALSAVISAAIGFVFYLIVRLAEEHKAWWGKLLGAVRIVTAVVQNVDGSYTITDVPATKIPAIVPTAPPAAEQTQVIATADPTPTLAMSTPASALVPHRTTIQPAPGVVDPPAPAPETPAPAPTGAPQ
jgi:hypothetical protein